jgi:hypothetical protein
MPTAKNNVVQFKGRRFKTPEAHADWVKHDRIANRLRDIDNQIGVIYWACSGLRETIGEGDEMQGLVDMAHNLQRELEAIVEEVR